MDFFSSGSFTAFLQVIFIDLVLAGDNAVVIGMAAAGLPARLRAKAIIVGIFAATVLRIAFAAMATQLLAFTGLLLAGGLLLLWVCFKMWQELHGDDDPGEAVEVAHRAELIVHAGARKTLGQAVMQIVIADVSMSLDNVLAVAGAAQRHLEALVFGLALSVLLMGLASSMIARLLNRFRWIAWVGLAIILYVALRMIYEGADQIVGHALPAIPFIKGPMPITLPTISLVG
ncbi:MAG TPA: TerC family protein [Devosia sp.]|nr:TerC family protein [Devosia sp.]